MSSLESLRGGSRQDVLLPNEMAAQIEAVQTLVRTAHDRLVQHQSNRDAESDWKPESCRYDALFAIPDYDAVLIITSVGLPDEKSANGLFVYIHRRQLEKMASEVVGLQTAKLPEMVDQQEALWLSGYRPEQLKEIARLIEMALPISRETYTDLITLPIKVRPT